MSDNEHGDGGAIAWVHGVSPEDLEATANALRELFESVNRLAGKRIPVEMLRKVGEQLAIADDLAGILTREAELSLDLFALIWKTRLLVEDLDFGGITGRELMDRARRDRLARN
jgi:hypothetical protein